MTFSLSNDAVLKESSLFIWIGEVIFQFFCKCLKRYCHVGMSDGAKRNFFWGCRLS